MSMRVERVEAAGLQPASVGESPVWRAAEQALYWVDIPAQQIVRLRVESGERHAWRLPEKVACIAFDRRGTVLAGCETGLFAVTLPDRGSQADPHGDPMNVTGRLLAAPRFAAGGMRFNDGRCDRQGRFWSGTMVQDMSAANPVGALYRFDAQGVLSAPVVDGLITQNGLAWSPDGKTMYLSDSHPLRRLIWAFDYDTDTGEPRSRRVFADLHHHVGRPDGAAVDADGCYWICANDAGQLLRFTPSGKLDRRIAVPALKPAMCAFGGRDLDTLYVTSIRPGANASEHDGHLFACAPELTACLNPNTPVCFSERSVGAQSFAVVSLKNAVHSTKRRAYSSLVVQRVSANRLGAEKSRISKRGLHPFLPRRLKPNYVKPLASTR